MRVKVGYQLRRAADGKGHHGQSASHRLHGRQGEGLLYGRHGEEVGGRQRLAQCLGRRLEAWFYERFPRRAMVPHSDIMFEGHLFEGPADPDEHCRIIYGDYMQLPPRENRDRHKMDIELFD